MTLHTKEARFHRWIRANVKPGERFMSSAPAKALGLMPIDIGKKAGILVEQGILREAGRDSSGRHIWEVPA